MPYKATRLDFFVFSTTLSILHITQDNTECVVLRQLDEVGLGSLLAHFQQLDEVGGEHRQVAGEKTVRVAVAALAASTTHAVTVLLQVQGEVVVHHVLEAVDVDSTSSNISGH